MVDQSTCRRVLIYGGTFDPPHRAHLELPELARQAVHADAIIYVPAATSPFKTDAPPTEASHRLAMLELALANLKHAAISTVEIDRATENEPSYTIDTLRMMRDRLGAGVELRLLIGSDQLRSFDHWKDWRRIIELAEPAVMIRPPDTRDEVLAALPPDFPRSKWESRILDLPLIDQSATDVRERLEKGRKVGDAIPENVKAYIAEHNLYRN